MCRQVYSILCLGLFFGLGSGLTATGDGSLEERIRASVALAVKECVEADSCEVGVDVSRLPGWAVTDGEGLEIQLGLDGEGDALRGRVMVPVYLVRSGETVLKTFATATVRVFDSVWVARYLLNRHHVLTEADVNEEMREVTDMAWPAVRSKETLLGKRTKRVVGRGRVIDVDMIEVLPLVRRGDRVNIRVVYSNLVVTTTGFARTDGWLGDRIRVRDSRSHCEIVGLVRDAKTVEVHL